MSQQATASQTTDVQVSAATSLHPFELQSAETSIPASLLFMAFVEPTKKRKHKHVDRVLRKMGR